MTRNLFVNVLTGGFVAQYYIILGIGRIYDTRRCSRVLNTRVLFPSFLPFLLRFSLFFSSLLWALLYPCQELWAAGPKQEPELLKTQTAGGFNHEFLKANTED